jgi:hypothetical protein
MPALLRLAAWRDVPTMKMFDRQRTALNPGAVEANLAGKITPEQRVQLAARATGAALGWVSMTVFAVVAWWFVLIAGERWMAGPGLIAAVAAPVALWALYLIVADLRCGGVVTVTGRATILQEASDENPFRVRLAGRRLRLPIAVADLLRRPGSLTAFYTPRSQMLVNLTCAEDGAE